MRKTVEERFWEKVEKTDGCWIWAGALNSHGYGNFWDGEHYTGAHRFAAGATHMDGKELDHLCRNRRCVRPDRLEAVTHKINLNRGEGESHTLAQAGICRGGHLLSEAYVTPTGKRQCRVCSARRARVSRGTAEGRARYNAYMRRYREELK